jgi:signal transduction histidine kinase
MPQKRSPLPGWSSFMPGATSPRSTSVAELRPPPHVPSILVRPTAPSVTLGLVVAASLIVAETVLGYLLGRVASQEALGVVYLLGVVVVAMGWGFWLAAATSVASALAFDFFLIKPIWSLTVTDPRDWVALAVFLVVALVASTVADLARRAAEADQRRREAELAAELGRVLAEQQAALRRVATLVARGTPPTEVFSAVAEEMARCLNADNASVSRFDGETLLILALARMEAGMKNKPQVGESLSSAGDNVATRVFHTGRPARLNSVEMQGARGPMAAGLRKMGLRCTVAVPIVVDGNVWGMAAVGSTCPEPMAPDTEQRLGDFADLVTTAISSAATRTELQASRDELRVLAEQQAALRRVATLVARGVAPSEVFEAVADEMARCVHVTHATVSRYDAEASIPFAVYHGDRLRKLPEGLRLPLEGDNVATRVFRSGHTARIDSHDDAPGLHAARIRELGIRSAVGVPIVVDGRVWGAAIVGSSASEPLPPDTEARIGDFTDLVATAIANAATRAELIASRARIVAAADDARRRIERDLHDGAQQRLVALGLGLRAAEACVPDELQPLREQIAGLVTTVAAVSAEVQEISRGIHPAILSKGGLAPALKTLARRCAVPVDLDLDVDQRFADSVEVGAYYVVAEALTNAAKHARASVVEVCAHATGSTLRLVIRDDGIGGAAAGKGSGLTGLIDRVEALGGKMTIESQPGRGTSLLINIPLETT